MLSKKERREQRRSFAVEASLQSFIIDVAKK
jgi:hypothetical protein